MLQAGQKQQRSSQEENKPVLKTTSFVLKLSQIGKKNPTNLTQSLHILIRIRDSEGATQMNSSGTAGNITNNTVLLGFIPFFKMLGNWMPLLLIKFIFPFFYNA